MLFTCENNDFTYVMRYENSFFDSIDFFVFDSAKLNKFSVFTLRSGRLIVPYMKNSKLSFSTCYFDLNCLDFSETYVDESLNAYVFESLTDQNLAEP